MSEISSSRDIVFQSIDDCLLNMLNRNIVYKIVKESTNPKVYVWDTNHYSLDVTASLRDACRDVVRSFFEKAQHAQPYPKADAMVEGFLVSASTIDGYKNKSGGLVYFTDKLFKHCVEMASSFDEALFDSDPYELNTPSGILDLRSCDIRQATPSDLVSKVTCGDFIYEYFNDHSMSEDIIRIIKRQMQGNMGLVNNVLDCLSLGLLGENRFRKFFIFVGPGRTGKTTLMNSIQCCLGGYCNPINPSSFIYTKRSDPQLRPDITRASQYRVVLGSECTSQSTWDTALLKAITGNDKTKFREFFKVAETVTCKMKIYISTNQLPQIPTFLDTAFLDRMVLIRFDNALMESEQDFGLEQRISSQDSLNRMLSGLAYRLQKKLGDTQFDLPAQFRMTKEKAQITEDPITQFLIMGMKFAKQRMRTDRVYSASELFHIYTDVFLPVTFSSRCPSNKEFGNRATEFCEEYAIEGVYKKKGQRSMEYGGFDYDFLYSCYQMPGLGGNNCFNPSNSLAVTSYSQMALGSNAGSMVPFPVYPNMSNSCCRNIGFENELDVDMVSEESIEELKAAVCSIDREEGYKREGGPTDRELMLYREALKAQDEIMNNLDNEVFSQEMVKGRAISDDEYFDLYAEMEDPFVSDLIREFESKYGDDYENNV